MKSITHRVINGVVGLFVLAMFAVAIVAGQVHSQPGAFAKSVSVASTLTLIANTADLTLKTGASAETCPAAR